jgi:hypothetical protein
MKPDEHVAPVVPASVTQLTSQAVLGIPGRLFREWVRAQRVRHGRVGKLIVVSVHDALAALRAEQTPANEEPEPELDRIRRAAGLRRVG